MTPKPEHQKVCTSTIVCIKVAKSGEPMASKADMELNGSVLNIKKMGKIHLNDGTNPHSRVDAYAGL